VTGHSEQDANALGGRSIRQWSQDVASGLRGRIGASVRLALAFELLRVVILAPLSAGVLSLALETWGRCSVGNFEIAAFLLSLPGLFAMVAIGTIAITTFYLEIAGLLLLLADPRGTVRGTLLAMGKNLPRLVALGFRQFAILIAVAAPFAGAIAGVVAVLWSGYDLNGLIVRKPPVFWVGVALGACLAAGYAILAAYLLLRWLFALPVLLFEKGAKAGEAMRASARHARGNYGTLLRLVLVWAVAVAVVTGMLMGGLRFAADWLLDRTSLSLSVLLPVTVVVLAVHGLVGAVLSILSSASFASLVFALYRRATGSQRGAREPIAANSGSPARLPSGWQVAGFFAALLGIAVALCYVLVSRVELNDRMEIIAHRGGASLAPENTVAAIRKAIEAGADWAEIDVQRTSDGAIVVVHDSDLVRVAGVSKRVDQSTLAEIKAVDVGSGFDGKFRGERVPTLDEVLAAAGDGIRLTIELKPNGPEDVAPLVRATLGAVRQAGMLGRCRLCSQSYESLELARQIEPTVPVGFIAGARLGDLSRLDVDFLMVAERMATRELVDAARIREIEVHAWTVNDPDAVVPLLDRGVANIITDDPAALRRRLEEVRELTPAARLVLRARNALAD
jgi:glycerophosphoryl diester phosphodiesterase